MTLIESEQSRDIPLTQIIRGPFVLRFASYRKGEAARSDLRSEDYFVSELKTERAVFGLCDGVGSSYYGNIGSQFLGETILGWLADIKRPLLENTGLGLSEWLESLKTGLHNELDASLDNASFFIQRKGLTGGNDLVRLAEKSQRDDFGTQSNFVGGVLWPKTNDLPNGLAIFFWLGNARLRIFQETSNDNFEELTHLTSWGENPDQLREVWSSKEGVIGKIYAFITDFSKITKIIVYSDGLESVESEIKPNLYLQNLESIVRQAQKLKDDDISYLEISLTERQNLDFADDIVDSARHLYHSDTKQGHVKQHAEEEDASKDKIKNPTIEINALKEKNLTLIALFVYMSLLVFMSLFVGIMFGYIFNERINNVIDNQQEATVTIPSPIPTILPSDTLTPAPSVEQASPVVSQTPETIVEGTPSVSPTPEIIIPSADVGPP